MKKVSIKAKGKEKAPTPDDWVSNRETVNNDGKGGGEQMKRLTIDVPLSLHKRIKTRCASEGLVMADQIREILEERFPATN